MYLFLQCTRTYPYNVLLLILIMYLYLLLLNLFIFFLDYMSFFNVELKKFVCNCGAKFSHKKNISHHVRNECGKRFQCPYCPYEIGKKCHLNQHIALKHFIQSINSFM